MHGRTSGAGDVTGTNTEAGRAGANEESRMSKNTGGPAFPVLNDTHHMIANMDTGARLAEGMSLRDYFAAKALPALIAGMADVECDDRFARARALSSEAYEYADAMLGAQDVVTTFAGLITALKDCVAVMERELNGLAVIQPELIQARKALFAAGAK